MTACFTLILSLRKPLLITKTDSLKYISRDGRVRAFNKILGPNIFSGTVKYKEVYIKTYENLLERHRNFDKHFIIYNRNRKH